MCIGMGSFFAILTAEVLWSGMFLYWFDLC
jgi:hypothetical protein